MPAYKDKAKGTWYASFYFENWTGKKEKKMKRGFKTKREALEWERTFLQQQTADLDMTFESFVALYAADVKGRIKENTWGTKEHILYKKLVPYFGSAHSAPTGSGFCRSIPSGRRAKRGAWAVPTPTGTTARPTPLTAAWRNSASSVTRSTAAA